MATNNNILAIIRGESSGNVDDMLKAVASNVKKRRLSRNLTQQAFAKRTGIPLSTYRRFEDKGEISLRSLAKIASLLGDQSQFQQLFQKEEYTSLDALMASKEVRKRGQINE